MDIEEKRAANSLRVLIVEDSDTDYLLLERQLQKLLEPMICARAANRRELIEMLRQTWNIIISDYHLPDIEGEGLLALIAQSHHDTPCLLLSGSIDSMVPITMPANVVARLEKGDSAALRAALLSTRQTYPNS